MGVHAAMPGLLAAAVLSFSVLGRACGSADADVPEMPARTPFPAALEERLHGIRDRAALIRGLPVGEDVEEGMLTREQLRAWYDGFEDAFSDDERRDLEASNQAYRLMHMIDADDDLLEIYTRSSAEDTLGFFSDDQNALVLVGDRTEIDAEDESVLAHEYVHSFQFAAFDTEMFDRLAEEEDEDSTTQYGTTLSCLLEGDAELSQYLYGRTFLADQQPTDDDEEDPAEESSADEIPPALYRYFYFDYNECALFALMLWGEDSGWDTLNEAYDKPPWTTEQILHPEKYLDREDVTQLAPVDLTKRLGKGWSRVERSVFGEFDAYNYLLTILGDDAVAAQAAAGWGAGWISIYARDAGKDGEGAAPEAVVHIQLDWDSRSDYLEFATAYGMTVGVLSEGGFTQGPKGMPLCWRGDPEYGYVTADDAHERVDIVIATTWEAIEAATSDSLSAPTVAGCDKPD